MMRLKIRWRVVVRSGCGLMAGDFDIAKATPRANGAHYRGWIRGQDELEILDSDKHYRLLYS
jgi:hypothetical protein